MQVIVAPIHTGDSGASVLNLQDALLLMIDKNIIWPLDAPKRPDAEELKGLVDKLLAEREQALYSETTQLVVRLFQIKQDLTVVITGMVDDITADRLNQHLKKLGAFDIDAVTFVVHGSVRDNQGKPQPKLNVRAFDKDLRKEQLLGESITDRQGAYEIKYSAEKFSEADNATAPDLLIRVFNDDGKTLAESTIVFNANNDEEINLDIVTPVFSEWERITAIVLPLLAGQNDDGTAVLPSDLNADDLNFIVRDTKIDQQQLHLWSAAARIAREVLLIPIADSVPRLESHYEPNNIASSDAVEWILFYAWFREDLPQDFSSLLRLSSNKLLSSLDHAITQNYIPAISVDLKEKVRVIIDSRQVNEAIKPAVEGQRASLGDAFITIPNSEKLKLDDPQGLGAQLASVLVQGQSSSEEKWKKIDALVNDRTLFNGIRRAVGLLELTAAYQPMMVALQLDEVDETAAALADLVKHDAKYWIGLAGKVGVPLQIEAATDEERITIYGRQIAQKIELMHPVPFVKHRVLSGEILVADDNKELLTKFFDANPSMRVADGSVLVWLESDSARLGDFTDEQIKKVTPELLRIERIAKLAPSLEHIGKLLASGYESARDIVHARTRDVFVDEILDVIQDSNEAHRIYDTASGIVATTEAMALTYSPRFGGINLPVMPSNSSGTSLTPLSLSVRSLTKSANFQRLFGSQDYCECSHGASLYGPAAYLADLLHMLARGPRVNGKTALDVLLDRRPDLADIDLTGDNANIALPYIDLVLEILESPDWEGNLAGSGFRVARTSDFDRSLDSGILPPALALDISSYGISLSDNVSVTRGGKVINSAGVMLDSWLIRDQQSGIKLRLIGAVYTAYRLQANLQSIKGASKSSQPWSSRLSATVLNISQAHFPWTLPYDGIRDQSNTWLKHLGVSRADAMQMLLSGGSWNNIDIACEYLNISPAERKIFTLPPLEGYKDWGFSMAVLPATAKIYDPIAGVDRIPSPVLVGQTVNWHSMLKHVSLLRSRAQLTQRELLNVLESSFIRGFNPARTEITGDQCNTGAMRLEAMSPELAHRIHIFVRLWRKLGWTTAELDSAINAYGIGTNAGGYEIISEAFLQFLSNIIRLRESSSLSIMQLLDLFGPSLDKTQFWDHTGALPQLKLSRYQVWFDNALLGKPRQPEFQYDPQTRKLKIIVRPADGLAKSRISDHTSYIAAALAMPESELIALLPQSTISIAPTRITNQQVLGVKVEISDAILKEIELVIGSISSNTVFSLLIEASNDGQNFIPVPLADLQVGIANPILINSSSALLTRLAYNGAAKFLRCSINPPVTGNPSLSVSVRVITTSGIVPDELSVENLTTLCRYKLLSRMLRISVNELQALMGLMDIGSLVSVNTPDKVLSLTAAHNSINQLGMSITQADELLRGPTQSQALSLDSHAEAVLTNIRAEAQAIKIQSTVSDDKKSILLKSVLTEFGWGERLISDVLSIEGLGAHFGDYQAALAAMPTLPVSVTLPAGLSYDLVNKRLIAARNIRPAVLKQGITLILPQITGDLLVALKAIQVEATLREQQLSTTQAWLRVKQLPIHRAALALAPNIKPEISEEWKTRFYYDHTNKELCLIGWITEADKSTLKSFENTPIANSVFSLAIDFLYSSSESYLAGNDNELIVREGTTGAVTIEALLLDTLGIEARSGVLLKVLLPEWRRKKLHAKIISEVQQQLSIPVESVEAMLALPYSAINSSPSFASLLAEPQFLSSAAAIKPTRLAFEQAFDAALRMLVLGQLVAKLKLDATQISWLSGVWNGVDLTALPTQNILRRSDADWSSLQTLSALNSLSKNATVGVFNLQKILAATALSGQAIDLKKISDALNCSQESLRIYASSEGFSIGDNAWFHTPANLLRLINCIQVTENLQIPTDLFVAIKKSQLTTRSVFEVETEVRILRQIAMSNSTDAGWGDAENKTLDGIRQRRRDATVAYLVQRHAVLDANDLYGHYLIDPQMNACMKTSRIKQAMSSVQLFIQRCFMNLEPDTPPNAIDKNHWGWMKNYRIWEANRKVLLYPENWIEPELRDDKTPFFDDVVSALQQGDATSEKAQNALQMFLENLTDLSYVNVVATCSDYDDAGRLLVTHVFAKTLAEPYTYWYRKFIKQNVSDLSSSDGVWTPWQAIGLDIEGDHLFPFVWQGRLFLFWAIFSEEAEEPTDAQLKANGKPKKYWRLKLAWSEFKSGKWGSRRIFSGELTSIHLDVTKPALSPKYFYFDVSNGGYAGATISIYHEQLGFLDYRPFSTIFFDGNSIQTVTGRYVYHANTRTYHFEQDAFSLAEAPVDGRASSRILLHTNMKLDLWRDFENWLMNPHQLQNSTWGAPVVNLGKLPRNGNLLFQSNTTGPHFNAPSTLITNNFEKASPFFIADRLRQFFVYPTWQWKHTPIYGQVGNYSAVIGIDISEVPQLHFYGLDWPQAKRLRKAFSNSGIDKLLSFDSQVEKPGDGVLGYFDEYMPSSDVLVKYPDGDLEFSSHSAASQYNWELFFHAPFSIACALSKNQRFEEARRWFHFIFDPTDDSADTSSKHFWQFRPFREAGQGLSVEELVRRLADSNDHTQEKSNFQTLIALWKNNPFQPHLVARMRIRAYMYTVVMKYIDNLVAWGDQLFRRDTLESLNEATQLYIVAAQILGRRPEGIPRRTRPVVKSFSELFQPDDLSNALVEAENLVPRGATSGNIQTLGNLKTLYFCVPNNPKLLEYYDRVEDRLFKLRNCMNIDGAVRHLPLFEPAIDPSVLVRAAAAGVDVSAVLADLNAPLPFYRFNVMAQKATELCSEVKSLGAALLSAIEKGDAETMALMRSGHELQMLKSVRMVKELQLHEAKANIDALGVSLDSAQKRFSHYIGLVSQLDSVSIPTGPVGVTIQGLALAAIEPIAKVATFVQSTNAMVDPIMAASIDMIKKSLARAAEALSATLPADNSATDKIPMNAAEKRQLSELKSAHDLQKKAMDQRLVAQVLAKIPDFTLGAQGWTSSPVVQLTLGGTLLSSFANFSASILDTEASEHTYRAGLHNTLAGYQRRAADWMLQAEIAAKDIEQITKQVAASNLRIAIASQELRNHDLQSENAQAVEEFMHGKYSNRELYNWMSEQLSNLYFQSYQLAYDVAKRAERCFKHELGVDSTFLKFGYWDGLKKGLLAGENLHSDIKRMEVAYLNQNARELEITKHVSLRQLSPKALLELRMTGSCEFDIPEWLLDLDFPGHYFRRVKSASVSLPCVVGPYTSLSGTLTSLKSIVRVRPARVIGDADQANLAVSHLPMQSIATSTGQNDSGMFEFSFRDERYLPFEGAGVTSTWRFTLPKEFRAFDYETISDLIMHVKYTARDGGEVLRTAATASIKSLLATLPSVTEPSPFQVLLSCRSDFPTEWALAGTQSDLKIAITRDLLPYWMTAANFVIREVHVADLLKTSLIMPTFELVPSMATPPPSSTVGKWWVNTPDQNGRWLVNLRQSRDGVKERFVLLSVGKTTA